MSQQLRRRGPTMSKWISVNIEMLKIRRGDVVWRLILFDGIVSNF